MQEPLAYSGATSPDELTEDVVFVSNPITLVSVGLMAGYFAFILLSLVFAAASLVAPSQGFPLARTVALVVSGAVAVVGVLESFRRFGGVEVTVNSWGVLLKKSGSVVQSCEWSEMTLLTSGHGWRAQIRLADQFGKPLSWFGVETKHPDRRIAQRVLRTRVRELKSLRTAEEPTKSPRQLSWQLCLGLVLVGLCFLPVFIAVKTHFIDAVASETASSLEKGLWLVALVLSGCMVGLVIVGAQLSQIPLQRKAIAATRKKNSTLTEFIAQRRGKLEAVVMTPGCWYQYVSPRQLGSTDDSIVGGVFMACLGIVLLVILGVLLSQPSKFDLEAAVLGVTLSSAALAAGLITTSLAVQARRTLYCAFQRIDDEHYVIRLNSGVAITCRLQSLPKRNRTATTSSARFASL